MPNHSGAALWEFAPAPRNLLPGVVSMVGYRLLGTPTPVHRGLPSHTLTLVLSLADPVVSAPTESALAEARGATIVLGGLHETAMFVEQSEGQHGVQLEISPLAARSLLGMPAAALPIDVMDGDAILGRAGALLRERVSEAPDWTAAFAAIVEFLRRDSVPRIRAEVAEAWRTLERHRGAVTVADVAEHVHLSTRQLGALFRREFGVSPKAAGMLMRYGHAVQRIAASVRETGSVELATVAARCGYADQAHLARDFARFTGTSATGWIAEEFRNIQDGGHVSGAGWTHDDSDDS